MPDDTKLEQLSLDEIEAELAARDGRAASLAASPRGVETPALVARLHELQKAIYGVDDRRDFWEFPDDSDRERSSGVAGFVRSADVADDGSDTLTLRTRPFRERRHGLCTTEPFAQQPTAPFGSGFLVAPDLVATAGHVIDAAGLGTTSIVFGFRMAGPDQPVTALPRGDVYRPVEVVGRVEERSGSDWALVRLDRPAAGRHIFPVRRSGRVREGAAVYVMGHPSRLPIKYAAGAAVRDNSPTSFFVANLDTYGGNSGSPVLGEDHVVEGILVRGEADFVHNGHCYESKVCPSTGCRGEDCTRTTEFASLIRG
jgi:hypothetical protein